MCIFLVEATGLEPAASCSQSKHSTKLSYASIKYYVLRFLEPADYQEKYSRLARLERIAILLIFLFLRLAESATGGARLRYLLPKQALYQTELRLDAPFCGAVRVRQLLYYISKSCNCQ